MAVEIFGIDEFEAVLPRFTRKIEMDEYVYRIPLSPRAEIVVRSTISVKGISRGTGKDSIRVWIEQDGRPFGSKDGNWITRTKGWQDRLIEKIGLLVMRYERAGNCPTCGERKAVFRSRKNVVFSICPVCPRGRNDWQKYEDASFSKDELFEYFGSSIEKGAKRVLTQNGREETGETAPESSDPPSSLPPLSFINENEPIDLYGDGDDMDDTQASLLSFVPNPEQKRAIEAPLDAVVRVLAPPGSGKTATLARRYAHMVEQGVSPSEIVAVTFNRTMADELLERIIAIISSVRGSSAERQICTIHALCSRILREEGDRRRLAKEWQVRKSLQAIAEKYWLNEERRPGYKEILTWIEEAKARGLPINDDMDFFMNHLADPDGYNLALARADFDRDMRRQNLLTFADMLLDVEQLLSRDSKVREKYQQRFKYIIQDEAQDANPQDWRILRILAEPQNNIWVCADVDQCMYSFRGANPDNLLVDFDELYPDNITIKLLVNYRSTREIVGSFQRLIRNNYSEVGGPFDQKYLKEVVPHDGAEDGTPISFSMFDDPRTEAREVATTILGLIANNGRQYGDFFVGARTRAQLAYVEGELARSKIPYINIAGSSFWLQAHVADVVAYVALAQDTGNSDALKRVYNIPTNEHVYTFGGKIGEYCPTRYLGREFLNKIQYQFENIERLINSADGWRYRTKEKDYTLYGPSKAQDLVAFVETLQSLIAQDISPGDLVKVILDDCYLKYLRYSEGITSGDEAENGKLVDLETVMEIAGQFTNVAEFLEYINQMQDAARAAENKDWSEYVVISTVHRLKGLERPVVFGIGLCETNDLVNTDMLPAGLLPHTFSKRPPPQFGVLPTGGMSELWSERVIAYVLVSRAKELVFLSGVYKYRKDVMGPSRFVSELGIELADVEKQNT